MKRESVNCSNIKSIWYWVFSSKLEIEFYSWDIIQYLKVPISVFEQIKHSASYFDYYNKNIRWVFNFKVVWSVS